MGVRKAFCLMIVFFGSCRLGWCVDVVEDIGLISQTAANQATNLVQVLSTVKNTLDSASNTKQQLAQIGSYANIQNLPGVSALQQGLGVFDQAQGTYKQLQGMTDVSQFSSQFQGVLNQYGNYQGLLTGSNTASGVAQSYTIPMDTAMGQAVNAYKNDVGTLDVQRQNLERQLTAAVSSLQNASSQSEVEKINGEIAAINGQLNSTNERIQQAAGASAQAAQQASAAADTVKQAKAVVNAQDAQNGEANFADKLQDSDTPVSW
jgi:hypothetical protein